MFAVLTGDLVASSELGPHEVDRSLDAISAASEVLATWPDVSVVGFARRGGDAWQIAFDAPRFGLRAALYVTACIRQLDKARATRIALASGEGHMPDRDPNAAHGAAFTASGRLLSHLPVARHLDDAAGGARSAATLLADHIAQGWTPAQARAVAAQLPPGAGTIAQTAATLSISRQAVSQALHAAGFPALQAALTALEAE